jgi:probable F420-dependent oxidoreductase
MLELAGERALGAHPYFVPVEHTAFAREVLGDGPMLCPEQAVVLSTDPEQARAAARLHMATYLTLPNYTNNLRRLGWGDDHLGDGGSDELVDAIVAWGDEQAIADRVQAHLDAGADHVCVQVLDSSAAALPMPQWRALAPVLTSL